MDGGGSCTRSVTQRNGNSSCVSTVLERGYNNIMLVEELLDGGMQAESSNTVPLDENLEAANVE